MGTHQWVFNFGGVQVQHGKEGFMVPVMLLITRG
jgi:hypothetical protein